MRRLFLAVTLAAVAAAGWLAAHSAAFNASLPSEALVQSLAPDYLAVDRYYNGVTNPLSIDTALQRLAPPRVPLDTQPYRPSVSIARAEDGIRLARGAETAVAALGATAQLLPVRAELERSYQYVEQSWQYEQQVEEALGRRVSGSRFAASTPDVQHAADQSMLAMRQASALHDQAITAVRALTSSGAARPAAASPTTSINDQAAALDGHFATRNLGTGANPIGRLIAPARGQP